MVILTFWVLWSTAPVDKRSMTREQKRVWRAEERAKRNVEDTRIIDSIVQSRDWQFIPSSMQQFAGPTRMIFRNYYVNVYPTYVQVYLPYIKGYVNQHIRLLNFDILQPQNYVITKTADGWTVSFTATAFSGDYYTFKFNIYTPSWEVILDISSIRYNTVTYNGTIIEN